MDLVDDQQPTPAAPALDNLPEGAAPEATPPEATAPEATPPEATPPDQTIAELATLTPGDPPPGTPAAWHAVKWAEVLCRLPGLRVRDVAGALGADIDSAEQIGSGILCTPPEGTDRFEIVVGYDDETVAFVEYQPSASVSIDELAEVLGAGEYAPMGPHEVAPTVVFPDIRPLNAARACSVLARLDSGWPQPSTVDRVTLYLQDW